LLKLDESNKDAWRVLNIILQKQCKFKEAKSRLPHFSRFQNIKPHHIRVQKLKTQCSAIEILKIQCL
jgi:hypothetical protein